MKPQISKLSRGASPRILIDFVCTLYANPTGVNVQFWALKRHLYALLQHAYLKCGRKSCAEMKVQQLLAVVSLLCYHLLTMWNKMFIIKLSDGGCHNIGWNSQHPGKWHQWNDSVCGKTCLLKPTPSERVYPCWTLYVQPSPSHGNLQPTSSQQARLSIWHRSSLGSGKLLYGKWSYIWPESKSNPYTRIQSWHVMHPKQME